MSILSRLFTRSSPRLALPAPRQVEYEIREDSWRNAITGLGTDNDRSTANSFCFRVGRSDEELRNVYQGSALMARFIDLEPDTCMAKGFQVTELSGDDATAFEAEMLRLNAFRHFADARRWARLFAGAIIFMQVNDGRVASLPVDEANIVNIGSLMVFDRTEVSIAKWNEDLGSECYGMPEIYRISCWGKMFEVHRTRVLHFDGTRVSRRMRREGANDGFGTSVVDQVWDSFQQYGTTHSYLNGAVSRAAQGVLALKDLNNSLLTSKFAKIAGRIRSLLKSMSAIGDIVIDADSERYEVVNRSMTGFEEAAEVFEARLVGDMGVPKSLLMMQAPGGLSNGENGGDWKAHAMDCGSKQQQIYEPLVKALVRYVFLSRNTPVIDPPQDFTITWPPILQMSEKEKAEIYALRAPGRSSDFLAGIISAAEGRNSDDVAESYHLDSQDGETIEPDLATSPAELRVVGT